MPDAGGARDRATRQTVHTPVQKCYAHIMKSERSLANAPRGIATRDALLNAALESFSRNGYGGTSIRDLARTAGIRESSVYKHFPSKQGIFDALIELADSRLTELGSQFGVTISDGTEAAAAYNGISEHRLLEIANGMFGFVLHDPVFTQLRRMLTIEQYRDPDVARRLDEYLIATPMAFQTQLFAALIAHGEFTDGVSPEQAALAFYGPIYMLIQLAETDEERAKALLATHVAGFRRTHLKAAQ